MPNSRRAMACTLVALFLLACSGCAREAPTPEPVAITFACLEGDAEYYAPLAKAFEDAHPNVTLTLLPLRLDALERVAAADADVLTVHTLQQRLAQGDLLSLDVRLAADDTFAEDELYPGTLELFVRDGKAWAIPIGVDVALMYYNRDLFDERGVTYPQPGWTWEDFLSTAINLSDPALGIYGYAASPPLEQALFVAQHGGTIVDDWQNPTRATFTEPATVEALQWYADLIYVHGVAPTLEEARRLFGQYGLGAGIAGSRIGLWIEWYSSRGGRTWGQDWDFAWGPTTLPRDRQAATMASVEGLAISAQTEHPEECWQWISFLSRQVPNGLVPARRPVAESAAYEQQVGAEMAAVVRMSMEQVVLIPPDLDAAFGELGVAWTEAVNAVVAGEASAEEALTAAQQKANR